jgi:hypothetical protein
LFKRTRLIYNLKGVYRSLTQVFKEYRDRTVGVNFIKTNELLIVLEKLVSTENISDENKRRGFKKN